MADPNHLEKLKSSFNAWNKWREEENIEEVDLSREELKNIDLRHRNLKNANLSKVRGRGIHFNGSDLEGAIFSNANLVNCSFQEANLRNVVFIEAQLEGADFNAAKFGANKFIGAKLNKCRFMHADLQNVNFSKATLSGANFSNSRIDRADFSFAVLSSAHMSGTTCEGTKFIRTKHLYGRNQAVMEKVKRAEYAIYGYKLEDYISWAKIRSYGELPLFGVSYFGIIGLTLYAVLLDKVNPWIANLKISGLPWAYKLPILPDGELKWTLLALVILAIATTAYKVCCPEEIKEYTEVRWQTEARDQPMLRYKGLSYSNLPGRIITALGYFAGGGWLVFLLVRRIYLAIRFYFGI